MAHNVSSALLWFFTFPLNLAQKTFEIPASYFIFSQKEILRGSTFISIETVCGEGDLKNPTKSSAAPTTPENAKAHHRKKH
jgi:hypothetical protein